MKYPLNEPATLRTFAVGIFKGGIVDQIADPDIANRSREFAVMYFRKNLGAN